MITAEVIEPKSVVVRYTTKCTFLHRNSATTVEEEQADG